MTPRPLRPLATGLVLALASPSIVAAQGVDALEAAAERFATVTSICADFSQEMRIELLRQTKNAAGTLCQRRPNLFSMAFSEPDGDRIVADGEHFWIYLKSESPDQVIRIPMASERGGLDFYRTFLEDPLQKYEATDAGEEIVEDTPTVAVRLVPKVPDEWRAATVWIDPTARMIRQVRIEETNGTVRTVTLRNIDLAPALGDDFFDYRAPDGVRVVAMSGGELQP